jgi:hypothetical protein
MLIALVVKRWLSARGRRLATEGAQTMESDSSPPTPPEAAPPGPLSPHHVARQGLLLYHNLNKLDRWGGGGFGLSTLVKLAGWAGLLAVLGTLVVKLRVVEQQLDPVSHGVDALRTELESARDELAKQARRNRSELEAAQADAAALREAIKATSSAHERAGASLTDADRETRALAEQLASELGEAKQLNDRETAAASDVGGFQDAMASAKARLGDAQTAAASSLGGLGDDLQSARTHAQALDHALTSYDLASLQSEWSLITTQEHALLAALQSATTDAQSLDHAIQERLIDERRAAEGGKEKAPLLASAAPPGAPPTGGTSKAAKPPSPATPSTLQPASSPALPPTPSAPN